MMEELFPTSVESPIPVAFLIAVLSASVAFFAFAYFSKSSKEVPVGYLFSGLLLIAEALMAGYSLSERASRLEASQLAAVSAQKAWVQSYGISLNEDELVDLEFPSQMPTENAEYGVTKLSSAANSAESVITVNLSWDNGEFVLYGSDGKDLKKLSPQSR